MSFKSNLYKIKVLRRGGLVRFDEVIQIDQKYKLYIRKKKYLKTLNTTINTLNLQMKLHNMSL